MFQRLRDLMTKATESLGIDVPVPPDVQSGIGQVGDAGARAADNAATTADSVATSAAETAAGAADTAAGAADEVSTTVSDAISGFLDKLGG